MGRPPSIDREQILEAARKVFLQKGFNASTSEVAKEAGVSEGSIFKRFPTKAELFREALGIPDVRIGDEIDAFFDASPFEEALEQVVLRIVELFRELLPRMMMLWAHHHGTGVSPLDAIRAKKNASPAPLLLLRTVTACLERVQRRGDIRGVDPEVFARVLIGACHSYTFMSLIGADSRQPMPAASYARAIADLVNRGVLPEDEDKES